LEQVATGGVSPYTYSNLSVNNGGDVYASQDTYSNLQSDVVYTIGVTDANGCVVTDTFSFDVSPDFTDFSLNVSDVSCNGGNDGTFVITGTTGGVAPFEYRLLQGGTEVRGWRNINNPWTDLPQGDYGAEVRDATGDTLSTAVEFTVNEPAVLTLTGTESGPNIFFNTSGGTPPYEYSSVSSSGP
jgi:hypothetical protein